jgi:hypothetical protein
VRGEIEVAAIQGAVAAELARVAPNGVASPAPAEKDRLLTPEEAAQILGVGAQYLGATTGDTVSPGS